MKYRCLFLILFISLGMVSCDVLVPLISGGILPTATNVPNLEPTKTMEPTKNIEPEATQTPMPSSPTPASTTQKPTKTPANDDHDQADNLPVFDIQPGSPIKMHAWIYGCSWLGIAGQVFMKGGQPAEELIIEAGGSLAGQDVLGLSITGSAGDYGPGGYEIQLWDQMVESSNAVWVQIKGSAGRALSEKIYLDTADDCNQNLIVLNFIEVDPFINHFYFPIVFQQ